MMLLSGGWKGVEGLCDRAGGCVIELEDVKARWRKKVWRESVKKRKMILGERESVAKIGECERVRSVRERQTPTIERKKGVVLAPSKARYVL